MIIIYSNEMLETYLIEDNRGYLVYYMDAKKRIELLRTKSLDKARKRFNKEVEKFGHYGHYI